MASYVVRVLEEDAEVPTLFERRYLGRIESVHSGIASLSDSDSDVREIALAKCYLEGSRGNIESVGRALLGNSYDAFSNDIQEKTYSVMGAEHQVKRLNDLGVWLENKSPLPCSVGLNIRVHKTPHECPRGTDAGTLHDFKSPNCVLRPGVRLLYRGLSISRSISMGRTTLNRFPTNECESP